MLISTISGKATFAAHKGVSNIEDTATINVFYRRSAESTADEQAISIAARDPRSGCQQISMTPIDASTQNKNNGRWFLGQYVVPEFSLVKIVIQKRNQTNFGYHSYHLMLRPRDTAALGRLRIALIPHPDATHAAGYIEGRYDIIPPEQFDAFGIKVWKNTLEHFEVNEFNVDFITYEELEVEKYPLRLPSSERIITDSGRALRIPGGARRVLITKPPAKRS
jgi:hypothetical protein